MDSICNFTPTNLNQVNANFTKSQPLVCDRSVFNLMTLIFIIPIELLVMRVGDPLSGGNNFSHFAKPLLINLVVSEVILLH